MIRRAPKWLPNEGMDEQLVLTELTMANPSRNETDSSLYSFFATVWPTERNQ